jgi:hypothetical protein
VIGNPIEKMLSLIGYLLMCFGNQYSNSLSITRAFGFSTQPSLPTPQEFFGFSKELGIINRPVIGVSEKSPFAYVNTNFLSGSRIGFKHHIVI